MRGPQIPEATRFAAAAQVLAGATQRSVAKALGIHENTVSSIMKQVREHQADPASLDWRKKLTEILPAKSVDAIERSIEDTTDKHKAASTALSHLKGIGVLAADSQTNVVIATQINALPTDWQSRYVSNEADSISAPSTDPHNSSDIDAENG